MDPSSLHVLVSFVYFMAVLFTSLFFVLSETSKTRIVKLGLTSLIIWFYGHLYVNTLLGLYLGYSDRNFYAHLLFLTLISLSLPFVYCKFCHLCQTFTPQAPPPLRRLPAAAA